MRDMCPQPVIEGARILARSLTRCSVTRNYKLDCIAIDAHLPHLMQAGTSAEETRVGRAMY